MSHVVRHATEDIWSNTLPSQSEIREEQYKMETDFPEDSSSFKASTKYDSPECLKPSESLHFPPVSTGNGDMKLLGEFDEFHDDLVFITDSTLEESWFDCSAFPLFELPKEIRLLIYEHALMVPERTLVDIDRIVIGEREPSDDDIFPATPGVWGPLYRASVLPLAPCLIRTCRAVYDESFPFLYRNIVFHPIDNNGLMPLFFKWLGPRARESIRAIRLELLLEGDARERFDWAMTCAQVATLKPTLVEVEVNYRNTIESENPIRHDNDYIFRRFVKPLCRIPCRKTLLVSDDVSTANKRTLMEGFDSLLELGHGMIMKKRVASEKTASAQDKSVYERIGGAHCKDGWKLVKLSDASDVSDSEWEDIREDYYFYKYPPQDPLI